jgi:hypothetical protein
MAFEMQSRAENAARAGRVLGALQLTMGARQRGQHALRVCRIEADPRDEADFALRRTDDLLARVRRRLAAEAPGTEPALERAGQALARALRLQEDAHRNLREERPDDAIRLTLASRSLAHHAVRLADGLPR